MQYYCMVSFLHKESCIRVTTLATAEMSPENLERFIS